MARDVDYTKWVNVWNKPAGKRPSETVGIKAIKIESTKPKTMCAVTIAGQSKIQELINVLEDGKEFLILNNLPSSDKKKETTEVAG